MRTEIDDAMGLQIREREREIVPDLVIDDYSEPKVHVVVKYDNEQKRFVLPNSIVHLSNIQLNGRELKIGRALSDNSNWDVVIRDNREIVFRLAVNFNDIVTAEGLVIIPTYNPTEKVLEEEIDFPDTWYHAIKSFVFAELFKKPKYKDVDMWKYYNAEYHSGVRFMNHPIKNTREGFPVI